MSGDTTTAAKDNSTVAIVCGGGSLPFALADAAQRRGRRAILFALIGWADPERVANYPHHWWRMGQFTRLIRIAEQEGCRDIVFIGSVTRPSWWQIRPDFRALWYVPQLIHLFRGGDDRLQSGVGRIVEQYGFRLLGPQDVAPELMMPLGPLSSRLPSERDRADIARGLAVLRATSPFDIGQAVVVAHNQVLAVEGPEGTDQALARVAELRRIGRIRTPAGVGVLVKAPKIGQDQRLDLPSIGPQTVDRAVAARLAGIAIVAGSSIVAEPEWLTVAADRAKMFVVGVNADGTVP